MAELTRRLYARGSEMAEQNGLILVDTKLRVWVQRRSFVPN